MHIARQTTTTRCVALLEQPTNRGAQWSREYERTQFRFADTNAGIGAATRDLFASWFPRVVTPIVRYSINAMLDDTMLESFGFPKPLALTRSMLRGALRLRGTAVRVLQARRTAHFFTDDRNRTEPMGYEIGKLGPHKLVAAERRREHEKK